MLDLFEPLFPEAELQHHFRLILSDPAYAKVLPVIQSSAIGLLDRRGESQKITKELQSSKARQGDLISELR